jgi:translation initiation factor 4A
MAEALDCHSGTFLDQAGIESNWTESVESFEGLALNEDLLRGIYAYGFEKPSAIQQKGILPLITGRDSICQAENGTGKTATIAIGVLQRVDVKSSTCQALLLVATRERAEQMQKMVRQLGDLVRVQCHACIGGGYVRNDIKKLQEGVHIVVGTPGRIYDMIDRRVLRVTDIKMVVLNEADEMLSRGYKDMIYDVFKFMSQKVQVCLFSATMRDDVLGITQHFMREPVRIDGQPPPPPQTVRQTCCCGFIVRSPHHHCRM